MSDTSTPADRQAFTNALEGAAPGPAMLALAAVVADSTATTQIGSVTINTQAKDARGIMGDIRREASRGSLVAQAATGLS